MEIVLLQATRQLIVTLILLLGGLSTLGCPEATGNRIEGDARTPARQFIMETVTIEERRNGILLWRGKGSHCTGDFETTAVKDVHLTRLAQSPTETTFTMISPKADLLLTEGEAAFTNVILSDPGGRTLTAGNAHYSETLGQINATGPLHLQAAGLQVNGTNSEVDLRTGTVLIEGPISGVFTPPTGPGSPPLPLPLEPSAHEPPKSP